MATIMPRHATERQNTAQTDTILSCNTVLLPLTRLITNTNYIPSVILSAERCVCA